MNIAICDDQRIFAEEIKKYVDYYFSCKNIPYSVEIFTDGKEAAESNTKFDIAFLDIEVGDINGLDVGKAMRENNKSIVFIVVTAYSKYLDDALDLQVLRFLDKPINSERVYTSLDRAVETVNASSVGFYLRDENSTYKKVPINEIVMVETDRRHSKVYTDDAVFSTRLKLSEWQGSLTAPYFVMPHSSFIVNMNKIVQFSRTEIILQGEEQYCVSIAPKRQSDFRRILTSYLESRR